MSAYATEGGELTDLEFSADGSSLFVGDAREQLVARVGACPIEGKLLFTNWGWTEGEGGAFLLEGNSATVTEVPMDGELSPLGDEVAYVLKAGEKVAIPEFWTRPRHAWKADIDGENALNLSAAAGLGGQNCYPAWSPDGSKLAFSHCDYVGERRPCEIGFEVWAIGADGTGARRVMPARPGSVPQWEWSADGDRLLVTNQVSVDPPEYETVSIDLEGGSLRALPTALGERRSPDGSRIVFRGQEPGTLEGAPGVWQQLRVADADGGNPQILVQQFIKDADVLRHWESVGEGGPWDEFWCIDVRTRAGPGDPVWSPRGDRIAFEAALPFDPEGAFYIQQQELWVYELDTGILTRLTDDELAADDPSWRGPNTYPDAPTVIIGSTTVAFSQVTKEGLTTAIRSRRPPESPGGYRCGGYYYDIRTTAEYTGPVTIRMHYEDEEVPGGGEESLRLLRYDTATGRWEDVTTSRDGEKNVVGAEVGSL